MAYSELSDDLCVFEDELTCKFLRSLKSLRNSRGLKLREASKMLSVSIAGLSHWENGDCMPMLSKLIKLAEFYKYDISDSINYKYYYKKIDSGSIKRSLKRYGLTFIELQIMTGHKYALISNSIRMNKKGTVACLARVLAVLKHEIVSAKYRRSYI